MPTINLILFYCGLRSGHFGQGTFIQSLLPYFQITPNIAVTLIKTDCDNISAVKVDTEDCMDIISIPYIHPATMLTGENNPVQKACVQRLVGIIYPYLKDKPNLLFWVNSIDFLNLAYELKEVFKKCKLFYVHHSFSWKYLINVPDPAFTAEWKKGNDSFHPKAFEMTGYQKSLALVADIVITVTDHAKDFFIQVLGIPERKIVTIYNGSLVPESKKETKTELRKKYGFTRSQKIILFSGRITADKGFPDLLKAFKLLADKNKKIRLVVMGAGRLFEHVSIVKPHWSKMVYTGSLEPPQVSDFYRLADIGVMPSLHEQCSFTAIEMRLHKLPMIVSGVDGLDELFTHEQDSLKLPVYINKAGERAINDREFADYMERLISDRKLARLLANNSFKKGLKEFSREEMWRKYGQVLKLMEFDK